MSTKNYYNWLMHVEDIASQSSVVFETRYTASLKTISGVYFMLVIAYRTTLLVLQLVFIRLLALHEHSTN